MKINYLKLNNIGPYVGEHKFDLNTNSSKNVILIGGKNGAGKTTFLKSIKFGLFGSFAMGLKTDTDRYFYEIKSLINNKSKKDFYIEISFDYIENFESKEYIMRREWYYIESEIKEKLTIFSNNELLNETDAKELSDKLRAVTSPQLINSYIFDGEKISSIIENGEISLYLEETFNSIFSIDLITQTKKDLASYLSKRANENQVKEQIDNINMISKINSLKNNIKLLEEEISSYKSNLANLISMKKANTDNFYKLGGLTKSQQESYMKKLDQFNKEKEEMNHKIRMFLESELPIFMNINLLNDAISQCNKEKYALYPDILSEIEKMTNYDLSNVKNILIEKIGNCDVIHNIDSDSLKYIINRVNETKYIVDDIKPYINSKIIKTDEYKLLKKNLIDNENTETINKLMDENRKIDISIIEITDSIKLLENNHKELCDELNVSFAIYEKLNEDIKKSSLHDMSFNAGKAALDICDKFITSLRKAKLVKISQIALSIFNDTIRKNDFITSLHINENFDLHLTNSNGIKMDPKTLSAGEMQILISSLIWAMFRISNRREMFIFDTPLARLDNENRHNFITKIISTISSQVVILSTDSEFVDKNLEAIEPVVFKKYLLEYIVDDNATKVSESYFGGK